MPLCDSASLRLCDSALKTREKNLGRSGLSVDDFGWVGGPCTLDPGSGRSVGFGPLDLDRVPG
jgi:hypothetical protein